MKGKRYYPFERNRYFYGKLLSVRDFEMEQEYFNNKRRCINRLVNGAGIVCGLDVVMVDEKTISLEKGLAIDYSGREIMVYTPIMKKLSTIDGFNVEGESKDLYLFIDYNEKGKEPINTIANNEGSGDNCEYNRYEETFNLFIQEEKSTLYEDNESLTENCQYVYIDDKIRISQKTPKYVKGDGEIELEVIIEKASGTTMVSFDYTIDMHLFKMQNGDRMMKVSFLEPEIDPKNKYILRYKVIADDAGEESVGRFELRKDSFKLTYKGVNIKKSHNAVNNVIFTSQPIEWKLEQDYYNKTMDEHTSRDDEKFICLAKISVIKAGGTYIINNIERNPFNQFVYSPMLLRKMFRNTQTSEKSFSISGQAEAYELDIHQKPEATLNYDPSSNLLDLKVGVPINASESSKIRSGIEEIALGLDARLHKKYFSDEIIHGHGLVPVAIQLSVFYDETEQSVLSSERQIISGDLGIFEKSPFEQSIPEISLASIVYIDRGSFRIGLKLLDSTELEKIKIVWTATKIENGIENEELMQNRDERVVVKIVPDTAMVKTREKIYFKATVEGTKDKGVKWLVDKDKGTIDDNGVYEAPATPGVYEITVVSIVNPKSEASAYVVVKND